MSFPKKQKNPNKIGKSIIKLLREQNRSNEEFEILVSRLTLEELIWLKLELSAKLFANNKFYGFTLWSTMPKIIKTSLINFALFSTSTKVEAARFLGITEERLYEITKQNKLI